MANGGLKLFFVHKCIFICYIQMYKLQSTCIAYILPMCNSADAKQRSVMQSLVINDIINHMLKNYTRRREDVQRVVINIFTSICIISAGTRISAYLERNLRRCIPL